MKKLRNIAFILAGLTAFVFVAGFTNGKKNTGSVNAAVSEELKDQKPVAVNCIQVIGDQIRVVAIATGCQPMNNSTCVLTNCPEKAAAPNRKVILFRCVNNQQQTVAVANGCATAQNSFCTPSSCPVGTSAVGVIGSN